MSDSEIHGNPRHKTVLIVDDDDIVREMLDFIVRKEGFRVETFQDGVEALDAIINRFPNRLPDLIILDLMMPRQGGFEVLRELQIGATAVIPIIVTTGRHFSDKLSGMLHAEPNVREFLPKPIQKETLVSAVHRILRTSTWHNPNPRVMG